MLRTGHWRYLIQTVRHVCVPFRREFHLGALVLSNKKLSQEKQPIKAVIFDMGGVILPNPKGIFQEFESRNNIPDGTLLSVIVEYGHMGAWAKLEMGLYTASEFIEHFSQECSEKVGRPVNVSELLPSFNRANVRPYPQVIDAIKCVRAEGLKIALLTNNWLNYQTQSFLPLDRTLFDVIIESAVVKCRKPNPKIYQMCLDRLKLSPEQTVFLDDLGINLKTANKMGIHTIKVTDPDQAVGDLERLLGFSLQGYMEGTVSIPQKLTIPIDELTSYLNQIFDLPPSNEVPLVRLYKHGMSNPTYYVRYAGREMVLRKKPPGKLIPLAHAVEREFRVMEALGKMGVPVPPMIAMCDDLSVLGTPFYLMGLVSGSIFKNPLLPEKHDFERKRIYSAMIDVLCKIHSVNITEAGLDDYGKKGNYVKRNFTRWAKQYETTKTKDIAAMTEMMEWIKDNLPENETTTVIHGDFRLDNIIFDSLDQKALAVIDWELSTLGDPLTDLATCCFMYYIPSDFPFLQGISDVDVSQYGIPTVQQILDQYTQIMNLPPITNWHFYIVYTFFRYAAILQGVYKRAISGQGTNPKAEASGKYMTILAEMGLQFMKQEKSSSNLLKSQSPISGTNHLSRRSFSTSAVKSSENYIPVSVKSLSPRVQEMHQRVKELICQSIMPLEGDFIKHIQSDKRWSPFEPLEALKAKAKSEGLWNLFLPLESDAEVKYGSGLTNVEYAFICEEMGRCFFAPEVFNCSAPDTGNMEVLVKYGNEEQKMIWLQPLLDGTIRSCFAMTEPEVACSDATNIQSSIVKDGDHYVINGHKWWISGALDTRCKLCIFMGKTSLTDARHKQQSLILVPMDTPGVSVIRPLNVYGYDDAPVGHGELTFKDVRVPASNLLLSEGQGFEIVQGRLGPGRIHHCMRLIGMSERALELMIQRVKSRTAFQKLLAEQGTIQADIAMSRLEIEQARLLVLKAAHMMDTVGNKAAAAEIAMIKVVAPNMALRVIDRAIQAYGGAGLHSDLPLANMFAWARVLRLADGPDEVHRQSIAKAEFRKYK